MFVWENHTCIEKPDPYNHEGHISIYGDHRKQRFLHKTTAGSYLPINSYLPAASGDQRPSSQVYNGGRKSSVASPTEETNSLFFARRGGLRNFVALCYKPYNQPIRAEKRTPHQHIDPFDQANIIFLYPQRQAVSHPLYQTPDDTQTQDQAATGLS